MKTPKWNASKCPGVRFREHPTRRHGTGKDRYYAIRYMFNGLRRQECLGWASEGWTPEKALQELAELKKNFRLGEDRPVSLKEKRETVEAKREKIKKQSLTLAEYFNDKYKPFIRIAKPEVTFKKECGHFQNWIRPALGQYPLRDLAPIHIERLKKTLLDAHKSPRTVQHVLSTVRQIWNKAKRENIVQGESPTKSVKLGNHDNKRMRFLTHEEADTLLAKLQATDKRNRELLPSGRSSLFEMALLSLHTGMRAGEIFSLKWGNVNTDSGQINIVDTKTGRNRVAFMTDEVKEVFASMEPGLANTFVFLNEIGGPFGEVPKTFRNIVEDLGFNDGIEDRRQRVTFHSLRHTFASWCVQSGEALYTVQNLLGHSTLIMTQRYSHLAPDNLQAAMKRFGEGVKAAKAKPKPHLELVK